MLLVPWVIPPAMSTLAWLWLFDPSYSAPSTGSWSMSASTASPWTGETGWARFSVILVNVWIGAPFFMIMYLAALKSVPEQLYEAAVDRRRHLVAAHLVRDPADDAQHHRHHRAVLADRHLRQLRHRARADRGRSAQHARTCSPPGRSGVGIESGDIPLGASVSLFMVPILAVAAIFILRDITKRGVKSDGRRRDRPRRRRRRAARKYGSMSRDRRWALRWSYFFLVLFAIFFLMPPVYMFITSLKTSAEISAATNPWWVYHADARRTTSSC